MSDTDLAQFHGVFFDEAAEHLAAMESLLLGMDVQAPEAEQLNAVFRAAHSIKGGAATFGFSEITEITHEMETVFDRVRKGEMPLSAPLVDAFLAAGDMLKAMLAARRGDGGGIEPAEVAALCSRLRAFLEPGGASPGAPQAASAAGATPRPQLFEIVFGPFDRKFPAAEVDRLLSDLRGFGELEETTPTARARRRGRAKPPAARVFRIRTEVSAADLGDALAFMADPARVQVRALEPAAPAEAEAAPEHKEDAGFGLFVDPAALPAAQAAAQGAPANVVPIRPQPKAAAPAAAENASIRVSVQKVDQLINLVGELVITQAMLAQTASRSDPVLYEALHNGLAQLERNTRDLQEAAMAIRMMPISFAFSRFPRLVRDLAHKLGKEVELHMVGEGTELDKGVIEAIVDPLTHLVRNSLDHGIEPPEERVAKGKLVRGTITLRAFHHGGSIVIEVSDDGAGLNREKILARARERGMSVSQDMADADVWQLIFEPGFSTAEAVTDVSGRGVGMDVVRRNIKQLGGRIDIESAAGIGTRIRIRLPLTLAILDGMSVRVGKEIFIVPLTFIAEALQPAPGAVRTLQGRGQVIAVRGEYLPVVSLGEVLGMAPDKRRFEDGILVIVEAEGGKSALFVDELVGQHQVVIKSLETNYRKVPGISGATIMGDGRVALILDVAHVVGHAHSRLDKAA
ncbi:MAG: chemotaxis protein CheW [Pseudomonadota bacterium]